MNFLRANRDCGRCVAWRVGRRAHLFFIAISALSLLLSNAVYSVEQPAPRTISDITALLDQHKPDPNLAEQNRAKAHAEPPVNLAGVDLATFLHARAWAAQAIGDSKREIADLRRVVELSNLDQYQQDLSNALMGAGSLLEGIRIRERLANSTVPGRVLSLYSVLTSTYQNLGDVDAARAALRRAEVGYSAVAVRSLNPSERDYFVYAARGNILWLERKLDQAEVAFRRAHREAQSGVGNIEKRLASGTLPPGQTPQSLTEIAINHLDGAELRLSQFLLDRNRLGEAELLLRDTLQRSLARRGRDNVRTARVMRLLSDILTRQGRYHEGLLMAEATVSAYERSGAEPFSAGLAGARRAVGRALVMQARWTGAVKAYDDMRAGLSAEPESLAALGKGEASWGLALVKTGRASDAISLLIPRMEQDIKVLGDSHPVVAFNRGVLGMAFARAGDKPRALAEFYASTAALLDAGILAGDRSASQTQLLRYILEGYIELLMDISGTGFEAGQHANALNLAFRFADVMRGHGVQGALSASAARAAAGDPVVADLVRKEQDLNEQARALYGYLFNQLSLKPEDQSPRLVGDMRKRLYEIGVERKQLQTELQRRFPRYADFVNPRPATLDQARASLREG